MGILEKIKGKREVSALRELPAGLQAEDPVNYNSVLDFLVGLIDEDYKKMTRSAEIYRKANKDVAKVVGVEDEPTTSIVMEKLEVSEAELDAMLNTPKDELTAAFLEDEIPAKNTKVQDTTKKIVVED